MINSKTFYSHLYTSENQSGLSELDSFFQNLSIPSLDAASGLEQLITLEEISRAICAMRSGKCPGSSSLPVEFSKKKKNSDQLAPLLLEMLNESFTANCLPPTLRQTFISLILKKNKDPRLYSSYMPILFINVDAKLLAKVLAMHFDLVLPSFISNN